VTFRKLRFLMIDNMGVAGEIAQRLELAEDGDIDGSAEGLLQLVESSDPVAQQKRTQCIGAEREGSHNVIVPTMAIPHDRYYNKFVGIGHDSQGTTERLCFTVQIAIHALKARIVEKMGYDR